MQAFLDPRTVALIGATDDPESPVGRSALENLLQAREERQLYAVNPHRRQAMGLRCYDKVGEIGEEIDLAVIVTPAASVPALVAECGEAGVKAAIILSSGFAEAGEGGRALEVAVRTVAARYPIRLLGPNCAGLIRPNANLRATNLDVAALPGRMAVLSQSGAYGARILEQLRAAGIGISLFASLGAMIDLDFGDLIDLLAHDGQTRSALIYMEKVGDAPRFMSAARAFALTKPLLVAKAGISSEAAQAMRWHTGAEVGRFEVYDAAFRRVGAVRVDEIDELVDGARILDSRHLPTGPRLAIITNGGGPGVTATDAISRCGAQLAEFASHSRQTLAAALPGRWSGGNPVDLLADGRAEHYLAALRTCLADPQTDGIVVIHAPQPGVSASQLAEAIVEVARKREKPILTVWLGDAEARSIHDQLARNHVPTFSAPEAAIGAYCHLLDYRRNLDQLYATPAELPIEAAPPIHHLKVALRRARHEGRTDLKPEEVQWFLTTYGIPCQAASTEREPGTDTQLTLAARRDVDFGATIVLAYRQEQGDRLDRRATGLPPLNQVTARDLLDRLGLAHKLASRQRPEGDAKIRELEVTLVRFANLIVDFPEFQSLEIGRLAVGHSPPLAAELSAQLTAVGNAGRRQPPHLVIAPYPSRYVTPWQLRDGTPVVLRPIRPEDEWLEEALIEGFSEETSRLRFFQVPREIDHLTLARFCNIDYGRELALIAEHTVGGQRHNIGVGRVSLQPDHQTAEFAVVVADAYQGKGLGTKLLDMLIGFCLERGLRQLYGVILPDNAAMIEVARRMGFVIEPGHHETRATLNLYPPSSS